MLFGEWVEVFGVSLSLARAKVLGTPYLHREEFQVLVGHHLIRREEV